ncbi:MULTISPECIES: DNA cytosine methyltransferase [Pseudomonas]|uniref:Cytosine-specific methyltransferase n=1 Tax=Pseudomonas aphyarum TaxID=2942629 RepID=A0ABT5PWK9_9PSED|nr:DNA cytosine methyltransferase [Pseudomonas aphyarum]MDD0972124.1 DNA cytosine methyltransferase [Pseudomonas aphyarum]MDD1128291.1 DNA cytosine methyltransferase [Pseudomonas aphyarum]
MRNIKTLSLFSGAGGLDVGFHMAGFKIVACVELEAKYCRSLESNKQRGILFDKDTVVHNLDIRKFDPGLYKDYGIECIIGGPPCQTFSAAGRRSGGVIGTQDLRGQLYEEYCHILDVIKPRVFVFENVYGLPGANNGEPWRQIVKAFSEHGYDLHAEVIDAADYGVPQHRERLVMVGVKAGDFKFPMPTHGPDSVSGKPLVSVEKAIFDLQIPGEKPSAGLGGLYGHLLPDVPEGLNYAYFTAEMGHPEPVFAWRSKFHDLLYKVNRHEPCRTLKASPGKFTGPFHWNSRHFTVDELKRLQSFPDEYIIEGSYGQCVEQIGNSVPPRLAYCIAMSVKEQIFSFESSGEFQSRPLLFKSSFRQRQRERSLSFKVVAAEAIKSKYGSLTNYLDPVAVAPKTTKSYIVRGNRYKREVLAKKPGKDILQYSQLVLTEGGSHIRLDMDECSNVGRSLIHIEIRLSGLKKYLPSFESLSLSANVRRVDDIFSCWKEIEVGLVERSKFFTLIDIYGHYANRGDVVDVETVVTRDSDSPLLRAVEFFGQTRNCGDFLTEESLMSSLHVTRKELESLIEAMRELRYDIRTSQSHPIIGKGRVLCTYPFPLLSPKAMVESKVKFTAIEEAVAVEV